MDFFSAVISGVLIFALQQIILKIFIEPIQDLKKEIQLTLHDCMYYTDVLTLHYFNDSHTEMFDTFRKHSSLLSSKSAIIPFVDFFALLNILPKRSSLIEACNLLIGISNTNTKNTSPEETNDQILTNYKTKVENLLKNNKTRMDHIVDFVVCILLIIGAVQTILWLIKIF